MPDAALDADVVLPEAVRHAAEAAAAALMRLAPRHVASPAWQHYHGRFVERYGPGTIVPVTELINPNTGLGFPAGFRDGPDEPMTGMTERDRKLLRLAADAPPLHPARPVACARPGNGYVTRPAITLPDGPTLQPRHQARFIAVSTAAAV